MAKRVRTKTSDEAPDINDLIANGNPIVGKVHVPTGNYEGYIEKGSAKITKTKGKNTYHAVAKLIITAPEEYAGDEDEGIAPSNERFFRNLNTQEKYDKFIGQLKVMDIEQPSSLDELAEAWAEAENFAIGFWVGETDNEFDPPVVIKERLEEESGGGQEETATSETTESASTEGEGSEYTRDDVKKMTDDELDDLVIECDLDPDDYATTAKKKQAVYKYLEI